MINVVTVHWQSPKWVEPQLDYLARHLDEPYRVYAALNGIDERALWARFHFAEDLPGTHGQKLNALATIMLVLSLAAALIGYVGYRWMSRGERTKGSVDALTGIAGI